MRLLRERHAVLVSHRNRDQTDPIAAARLSAEGSVVLTELPPSDGLSAPPADLVSQLVKPGLQVIR